MQQLATPIAAMNATQILDGHTHELAAYFQRVLGRYPQAPSRLMESIAYSLFAGGKRLRPALILECWRASCGDNRGISNQSALAAAAAMELIHTFSLVHDDLPAMDDDDLRRGRPTNHKVFGEAMAILAGDAMVTMAFEILAKDAEAGLVPMLVRELAAGSGPEGMIGGQVLDIDGENHSLKLEELQTLHRMKTGALLTVSCRLGTIAAGANAQILESMTRYGQHLGLAFQIVDDILDVTATAEQMGKATGKDAQKGKNTYPVLMGLEASRRQAGVELAAAIKAIEALGPAAEGLRVLAKFVVERNM